jgi:hypothetical protein
MTCHAQRQSRWEVHQSILSAVWEQLLSFTVAISKCFAVISPVCIQHVSKFTAYQQHTERISKLWATMPRVYTCTIVVVVGIKCSALSNSQDKGRYLQVHCESLQECQNIIQLIRQHLPAGHFHLNIHEVQLGDTPYASRWTHSSHQRNHANEMLQGLWTCLHCLQCPTTNMMQQMRAIILWTWGTHKANPQPA